MKNDESKLTLESMSQAAWYNQWTMKKFTPFLKGEILEVGCGIGNFTKSLTKYGNVWAIDINDGYLIQTKKRVNKKTQIGFGDIEKGQYFFNKRKFNSIVCLNVLEHISQDKAALKNLYSLLEDGGFLIILVPIHPLLFGKIDKLIGHFRRYTIKDLTEKIKNAHFSILKYRKLNFLGAIGWFFSGKILNRAIVSESQIKFFNILAPFILPFENIIETPIGTSLLVIAQKKI